MLARASLFGLLGLPVCTALLALAAIASCSADDSASTSPPDGAAPADGAVGPDAATADGTTVTDGSSTSDGSSASDGSPPADAGPPVPVHFLGRFDRSDPAGPAFAWPGTGIVARVTGTAVDVRLHDNGTNQFAVFIDGAATPKLLKTSAATDTYNLASGLVNGPHDVAIYKRTESFQGVVQWKGFVQPTVATPPPFARRIEVIGDSITCGYGDEGAGPNCPFSADTEDEVAAYGALAARDLNAAHAAIAYSGIGVYRANGGSTQNQMPVLFERTLADQPGSVWDFSQWTPADVVVINLGTNDFAQSDPGQPFVDAYLAFVKQVRGHYKGAFILCALSPMLSDGYPVNAMSRTKARAYLSSVVTTLRGQGDAKVSLVEFAEQQASDGYGCDYHPSLKTHRNMANVLTPAIKALTGW